jgi:hypothetical protein
MTDSRVPGFQGSRVPGFQGSRVPEFQSSRIPGIEGLKNKKHRNYVINYELITS